MSDVKTYLSRDAIFGAKDLKTEEVYIPEWGGTVRVRGLTAGERDAFEASIVSGRGKDTRVNLQNIRAKFVALVVVNEDGERLFADSDAGMLATKAGAAMERIFDAGRRLSGMTDEDVDELAGNSTGQSGASSSA